MNNCNDNIVYLALASNQVDMPSKERRWPRLTLSNWNLTPTIFIYIVKVKIVLFNILYRLNLLSYFGVIPNTVVR